jgi:hypothetical protein
VRCSSLVDWPVYPRLRHDMRASNGAQCEPTHPVPSGQVRHGRKYGLPRFTRASGGHQREAKPGSRWPILGGLKSLKDRFQGLLATTPAPGPETGVLSLLWRFPPARRRVRLCTSAGGVETEFSHFSGLRGIIQPSRSCESGQGPIIDPIVAAFNAGGGGWNRRNRRGAA